MTQAVAKTALSVAVALGVTACGASEDPEATAGSPTVPDVVPMAEHGDGGVVEFHQDRGNADYEGEELARWADGADPDACSAAQGMGIDDSGHFTFASEGC